MPNDFLSKIPPELAGVGLAMVISFLRIAYDGRETSPVRICLESMICGALSLTAYYGIKALGADLDWAIFAGGTIGYLGPASVRALAVRFLRNKSS
jgi:lambda family phage holin